MKQLFTFVFLIFVLVSCSQNTETKTQKTESSIEKVTFVTDFDIANATKDGFYIDEYVVNIDYARAKELDGKKIRITGEVTIVKGLGSSPKEYDENGNEIFSQGRVGDTKHILSPEIEIVEDKGNVED